MFKKLTWLIVFTVRGVCPAQVVFSEPFDETDFSVSGIDNVGGVTWTTSCPACVAGVDWFDVRGNQLECEDTNGPATWTTGAIDMTACTGNALISFTVTEAGDLEECAAGCGCNCVDWILVEYSINGGSFASASSPIGGPCAQGCSGGNYAVLGDAAVFPYSFTYCIPINSQDLVLRISVQTWANGERYRIDDVVVQCFTCVLPTRLTSFSATPQAAAVWLEWAADHEEENTLYRIDKSTDGFSFTAMDSVPATAVFSGNISHYAMMDMNPQPGPNYYRLCALYTDGRSYSSAIVVAVIEPSVAFAVQYHNQKINFSGCKTGDVIEIRNLLGQKLAAFTATHDSFSVNYSLLPGAWLACNLSRQQAVKWIVLEP